MIKYINAVLITLVMIILGFIIYNKLFRYTNEIPSFSYTNLKTNLSFTKESIPKDRETIIAYVSTTCGSCENVINSINKNLDSNTTYIIVTTEKNIVSSKLFFDKFSLNKRIILLNDTKSTFTKDFRLGISIIYPTVFYFNSKGELMKVTNNFNKKQ